MVLYGHRGEKSGESVAIMNRNTHNPTKEIVVQPMLLCTENVKKQSPVKKSARDNCSSRGSMATISKTFHRMSPGYLNRWIRRRARGEVYSPAMNSLNHCLTSMPNDAVTRLRIRLANHNMFTRLAEVEGDGELQEDSAIQVRVLALIGKFVKFSWASNI